MGSPACDGQGDVVRGDLHVQVIAHGGLLTRERGGETPRVVRVQAASTLADVLVSLGIDPGVVGVAAREGRFVRLNEALGAGDIIDVYPIFGGG